MLILSDMALALVCLGALLVIFLSLSETKERN
jgi:hypothetical protein